MSVNINERFEIPDGASITNIKNNFNDFVFQIQNSSFKNLLRNSLFREHFAGVPAPYMWDVDSGITINTSDPVTILTFGAQNQQVSQSIVQSLDPIFQYLMPSMEYLAIFDITPSHNCELGIRYDAGIINLLGTGSVSGSNNDLSKIVYAGNTDIIYFVFKTAEDFSNVRFYIKNIATTNTITVRKLALVKGTLNLLDCIEPNLFLDHIRYNSILLHWEYTNDGVIWQPFIEGLNVESQSIINFDTARRFAHYFGRQ